ncbi:MAG TPA: hypothetical protein VKF42_08785 [Chitinivibrionales bacterium]|jgi:hypothetical protein|nr:hypothetical protein [Chitinivibrionales bacterium]
MMQSRLWAYIGASLVWAAVPLLLRCGKSQSVVGAGSETTNARVTAVIYKSDGSPAAGATVRLRSSDYVTQPPALAKAAIYGADALTDSQGRFEIDDIDPGSYCIEVNDGGSSVLFACSLAVHDTVHLGTGTLRPYAAVIGTIDSLTETAYAQVYGLERLASLSSSGRFAFTDLPQGVLKVRVTAPGAPAPTVEIANVKTTAGDTTTIAAEECTNPVFVTGDPNGGWSDSGYYVHNNMWNSASYQCAETLYACSYHNWYVVANMNNNIGDGAVKAYPNVHMDFDSVPISSFKAITSTFSETSPHVGIYDVAYSIWTNGVAAAGSTELMIWTENYNQVPSGSLAATVTLSGVTYNVWKTSTNGYIAFVPTAVFTTGTVDILEIFNWTISKGWLPANSTLGQIGFGVEIVSTNSTNAVFKFTDFSITTNQ